MHAGKTFTHDKIKEAPRLAKTKFLTAPSTGKGTEPRGSLNCTLNSFLEKQERRVWKEAGSHDFSKKMKLECV